MRYTGYRPSPYRGRRSKKPLAIVLACTLLVLGVFWSCISDYIIFSADGFEFGSTLERPVDEPPTQEFEKPNYIIEEPTPADPLPSPKSPRTVSPILESVAARESM